jgi:molybdopterin-binding protein
VVAALRPAGDQVRVVVDVGFPVVAALTGRSAEELDLRVGQPVVVVFGADAMHVIPGPSA